jgi:hypothetical protein
VNTWVVHGTMDEGVRLNKPTNPSVHNHINLKNFTQNYYYFYKTLGSYMKIRNIFFVFTFFLAAMTLSAQAEGNQEATQDSEKLTENMTNSTPLCGRWYDGRCIAN